MAHWLTLYSVSHGPFPKGLMQSYELILREKGLDQPNLARLLWAGDPYAQRVQGALRRVCRPDYSVGMILWLNQAYPDLYAEVTERLPEEIQRLWSQHAPLEQFQRVLERLVETHQNACALYTAYLTSV